MFKISVIGKANVGKSTLFNRLVGRNIALTNDIAGLTRDRKESRGRLFDLEFIVIDTGGYEEKEDIISTSIWQQAKEAILESDMILLVLDGKNGLTKEDYFLIDKLRKENKPSILCVNKADTKNSKENIDIYYELGFENICFISATHNQGMGDLHELISPFYKDYLRSNKNIDIKNDKPHLSIAFVGKPNAGKSTIINNLIDENRLITSDIMGTTRDSVYIDFPYQDHNLKIIDTAGLRRRSKIDDKVEKMASSESIRSINFVNTAILVISATDGLTKQDLTLAKYIVEEGRALIVVVNKIDIIKGSKKAFLDDISYKIEDNFFQIKKPYIIGISALKERDITRIIDVALILHQKWIFKASTSSINKWLRGAIAKNPPPMVKRRRLKIKYATQIKTRPPTIHLWVNIKEGFPDSYLRYLQNEFFKSFDLWGVTVRFFIKKSDNPYK